jgi:ubiquinone/menaquinone biosynthesis C-methylase UbiE
MKRVDYDWVAPAYDDRYARNRYDGIQACVTRFLTDAHRSVAEIGCGTGHWLAEFSGTGGTLIGLDLSEGMLTRRSRCCGRT